MTISGTTSDPPEFEQLLVTCGARLRAKVREARLRARVVAEATAEAEAFSGLRETEVLLAQPGPSSSPDQNW